jgi:hypothetical protein
MKRILIPIGGVAAMLLLAACTQLIIPPSPSSGGIQHPTGFTPMLVVRYHTIAQSEGDEGEIVQRPQFRSLVYRPGGSDFFGYEGWDQLEVPRNSENIANWLNVTLDRAATVVVIWEGNAGWLSGWNRIGEIAGKGVFRRNLGAGEFTLGSPGEGNDAYTVLFAEDDGQPSSAPPLPDGIDEADRPVPNAACPEWVDNLYLATGPDGLMYESWHPQIDPVYWCYFEHEHGSDPALVDYTPAFRYVADKNFGQNEQHEGFKGYAIQSIETETGQSYHWYVNIHSTTSAISRACARQHTVVIAVIDANTGELVAELGYKGDYGEVRSNQGDHTLIQPTFSGSCPDQQGISSELDGSGDDFEKRVRVANVGGMSNSGYESWRGGLHSTLGFSYSGSSGLHLDIRNPMTSCDTLACSGSISTGDNATRRTIRFSRVTLDGDADTVRLLDLADGVRDGVFYTDPYGFEPRDASDPNAIRQYIRPGLLATIDGHFASEDAWRGLMLSGAHVEDLELESGIGSAN